MIKSFRNQGTNDVFDRNNTKESRKICPNEILKIAQRKIDQLNAVSSLESLKIPPGNNLEALKDDRVGQHSIRINEKYRVCFVWTEDGAVDVEIVDYH